MFVSKKKYRSLLKENDSLRCALKEAREDFKEQERTANKFEHRYYVDIQATYDGYKFCIQSVGNNKIICTSRAYSSKRNVIKGVKNLVSGMGGRGVPNVYYKGELIDI